MCPIPGYGCPGQHDLQHVQKEFTANPACSIIPLKEPFQLWTISNLQWAFMTSPAYDCLAGRPCPAMSWSITSARRGRPAHHEAVRSLPASAKTRCEWFIFCCSRPFPYIVFPARQAVNYVWQQIFMKILRSYEQAQIHAPSLMRHAKEHPKYRPGKEEIPVTAERAWR